MKCYICEIDISEDKMKGHFDICFKNNINNMVTTTQLLTPVQEKAIDYSLKKSKIWERNMYDSILFRYKKLGYNKEELDKSINYLKHVPIAIHFKFETTFDFLLRDGLYKNLFETRKGNGGNDLDSRDNWEKTLFNNIYNNAKDYERVKYGALNITLNPQGTTAISYGESYIVLSPEVYPRTSIIVGDSCEKHLLLGTMTHPACILNVINDKLVKYVVEISTNLVSYKPNDYGKFIEAQIHGPLRMDKDIASIHIGVSESPTIIKKLEEFRRKFRIPYYFIEKIDY